MTWHEAMDRYGVDKPDLRFGMELVELTEVFAKSGFKAFAGAAAVKGIRVPGGAAEYGRNKLDGLTDRAKQLGRQGPRVAQGADGGALRLTGRQVPLRRRAGGGDRRAGRRSRATSCCSWPTSGRRPCEVLGQLRNDLGRPPVHEGPYRYVWVVDFPMFVGVDEATGRPKPAHHPFTRPHPDDIDRLESDPMAVRSRAYDLVLNGWELGSGSIRIHEPELQQRVFDLLGIDEEEANKRFGFFLTPFRYGAPPHGGFAFGIDRLVAILAGEENIREVIAFPKTQSGSDPMTNSPTPGRRAPPARARPAPAAAEVVNETTHAGWPPTRWWSGSSWPIGSWVDVVRGLVPAADAVHDELVAKVAWEQGKVFRYERWIDEPRLGAVQKGDDRHPALREAQTWLMRRYRISLPASVPLALYRDERDSVGFHRDRELRWLEDTVIGVLTLGAQRPWLMKPLGRSGQRTFADDEDMTGVIDLAPASGDLLVMGGRCQAAWLHAVPKVPGRCRTPDLGPVAVDVTHGPARPEPELLRAASLRPVS